MRVLLTALMMACLASPGMGQTPDPGKLESLTKAEEDARAKEAELSKKRKSVSAEISKLKKSLQKAASQTRAFEREAQTLQTELEELKARTAQIETELAEDRAGMSQLLAALQRLQANPPPTLATNPDNAVEAAQAAQLMGQLSTQLRNRADQLSLSLTEMAKAKRDIAERHTALETNRKTLEKRNKDTRNLVAKKSDLQKSIESEEAKAREEVKKLAAESATLRELIANFEAEVAAIGPRVKPKGKGTKPRVKPLTLPKGTQKFASAKGKLTRPIIGKLLRGYGKGEKGLTYTGQNSGQVLAPYAGRVEFAGPFKNYDKVVILNVGDGYFILLTGLGEIFSGTGDVVRVGEPIGLLPYKADGKPNIYFELRKDGSTLNPAPWLEPRSVKSG